MQFRRTSLYGALEEVRNGKPHMGIDYAMPKGTPIESVADGIVTKVVDLGNHNAGKMIQVKMENGETAIYGHLDKFKVHEGDHVHAGDIIGLSGNTGHSTGPHLHFGLKDSHGHFINPDKYDVAIQHMGDKHPLVFTGDHSDLVGPLPRIFGEGHYGIGTRIADKYHEITDKMATQPIEWVGEGFVALMKPIGEFLKVGVMTLVDTLNFYSPEIITLALTVCGAGMMIGALTGHTAKWTTAGFLTLWGGITWRVLI